MGLTKPLTLSVDYNVFRKTVIAAIRAATGLDNNHVIVSEPETQNHPRPSLPYMDMKITTPASRYGDDTKQNVPDNMGNPTNNWSSGGPRKMTISFNSYAIAHEDAYDLMTLWQAALDEENTQEALRAAGIAVWIIGTVADLSALLNTGYEGRAQMDCQFGIAVNVTSNLGEIDTVPVTGTINTLKDTQVRTETD